jgi:predicted ATPase
MSDLGQVNLLVGTNNSGKTSLLEAIEILVSTGQVDGVIGTLNRRNERNVSENRGNVPEIRNSFHTTRLRYLFYKRQFDALLPIFIKGKNDDFTFQFSAKIIERDKETVVLPIEPVDENGTENNEVFGSSVVELNWGENLKNSILLPVNGEMRVLRNRDKGVPLRFVTATALSSRDVIRDFISIVLTPSESLVLDAVKIIEPLIERIVTGDTEINPYSEKSGILVGIKGANEPIPIGSMGDGVWRMLGIVLSLVNARDGILLIDEIDTGFHYTVMEKMWQLVQETAKKLNVQVFATTHSRDCYQALAAIARTDVNQNSTVSIQRIERGKEKAVSFSEQEIVIAAENGIEVR